MKFIFFISINADNPNIVIISRDNNRSKFYYKTADKNIKNLINALDNVSSKVYSVNDGWINWLVNY